MTTPTQAQKFCTNLVGLIDLVRDLVENAFNKGYETIHPALLIGASSYISDMNKDDLLNGFIQHSHQHWNQIRLKNENFFSTNVKSIFGGYGNVMEHANAFKQLFDLRDKNGNLVINEDDRESVWIFLGTLVRISIVHVRNERIKNPELYDSINVEKLIAEWGIKIAN